MIMKKILLFVFALIVTNFTVAQATYETTGNTSDWNDSAGDGTSAFTLASGSAADSDSDGIPDSNDTVHILHDITVDAATTIGTLKTFAPGLVTKTLTILNGATLTVGGLVTNEGAIVLGDENGVGTIDISGDVNNDNAITVGAGSTFIMSSSSTFYADGSIVINSASDTFGSVVMPGTFTPDAIGWQFEYGRYVNSVAGDWDLISSPVSDQPISTFVTNNSDIAQGSGSSSGQIAIGVYTNTAAAHGAGNDWVNYTTGNVSSAGSFTTAKGYQMATTGGSKVEFRGTPHTGTQTIEISWNEAGNPGENDPSNGTKWNLVGNPYPSYITVTDFINGNTSVLESAHQAVYGWNGTDYTTKNLATAGYIAPAQGFMVADHGPSVGDTSTLSFTVSMMTSSANGADDFISGDMMNNDRAELFLNYNQNDISRGTEVYFLNDVNDQMNPGYDAGVLGLANTYIYTRLVEGDEGVDLGIQALAYSEMWDKVIPLGINALGGEEMTISISHRTTPADLNIYLEDTEEGTMTNLLDGDFVYTPAGDLEGVGRFFIHMTADTMSNGEVSTSLLNAYKEIDASYITIEGLATQSNETNVSLFNILGREVLSTTLNNNMGTQTISTVGLSTGIYVIELESGSDRLTKKLLIQ